MISAATSVIGNIYVVDYSVYYNHVCTVSLATKTILFQYEHGCRIRETEVTMNDYPDIEYGKLLSVQHQPYSQEKLASVLWKEQQERKRFAERNQHEYLSKL